MLNFLENIDQWLFLLLNGLHNKAFDFIMHWITLQQTWYPFYLLLIIWLVWKYRLNGVILILFIVLAITLSDQFTSSFMKPFFERLRPCHDPSISYLVHVVDGCGGQYGFASSHASNSFALATMLYLIFRHQFKYTSIIFIWAGLVSYSRIYVGVHFPGDIVVGAIVGYLIGWFLFVLYSKLPVKYRLSE